MLHQIKTPLSKFRSKLIQILFWIELSTLNLEKNQNKIKWQKPKKNTKIHIWDEIKYGLPRRTFLFWSSTLSSLSIRKNLRGFTGFEGVWGEKQWWSHEGGGKQESSAHDQTSISFSIFHVIEKNLTNLTGHQCKTFKLHKLFTTPDTDDRFW